MNDDPAILRIAPAGTVTLNGDRIRCERGVLRGGLICGSANRGDRKQHETNEEFHHPTPLNNRETANERRLRFRDYFNRT
jgi:hypothetical protein